MLHFIQLLFSQIKHDISQSFSKIEFNSIVDFSSNIELVEIFWLSFPKEVIGIVS